MHVRIPSFAFLSVTTLSQFSHPLFLSLSLSFPPLSPLSLSLSLSQDICMPAMRAQASAVYIGIVTVVASLGPVLVSLIDCKLVNLF